MPARPSSPRSRSLFPLDARYRPEGRRSPPQAPRVSAQPLSRVRHCPAGLRQRRDLPAGLSNTQNWTEPRQVASPAEAGPTEFLPARGCNISYRAWQTLVCGRKKAGEIWAVLNIGQYYANSAIRLIEVKHNLNRHTHSHGSAIWANRRLESPAANCFNRLLVQPESKPLRDVNVCRASIRRDHNQQENYPFEFFLHGFIGKLSSGAVGANRHADSFAAAARSSIADPIFISFLESIAVSVTNSISVPRTYTVPFTRPVRIGDLPQVGISPVRHLARNQDPRISDNRRRREEPRVHHRSRPRRNQLDCGKRRWLSRSRWSLVSAAAAAATTRWQLLCGRKPGEVVRERHESDR